MMSDFVRAHTGITNEVAFVGRGAFFQMWEPTRFEAYLAEARERLLRLRQPGQAGAGPAHRQASGAAPDRSSRHEPQAEAQLDPGGTAAHPGRLGCVLPVMRACRSLLRGARGRAADRMPAVRDVTRRALPLVRRALALRLPGRVRGVLRRPARERALRRPDPQTGALGETESAEPEVKAPPATVNGRLPPEAGFAGREARHGGSVRCAEGGGSWGNHGFPHAQKGARGGNMVSPTFRTSSRRSARSGSPSPCRPRTRAGCRAVRATPRTRRPGVSPGCRARSRAGTAPTAA